MLLRSGASSLNSLSHVQQIIHSICAQLADLVRPCLGPQGRLVLIQHQQQQSILSTDICNDGHSIVQGVKMAHPVGAILVRMVKQQHMGTGDGTKSCLLFASELISAAHDQMKREG